MHIMGRTEGIYEHKEKSGIVISQNIKENVGTKQMLQDLFLTAFFH